MSGLSKNDIIKTLQNIGIKNRVVGVHSKLSAIGEIEPTKVTNSELQKGARTFAKTVVNAFLEALGSNGTLFVPTHTVNGFSHLGPLKAKKEDNRTIDDGYYRPESTPTHNGSFSQTVLSNNKSVRSLNPTHSVAAIGKKALYLTKGHSHTSQPAGIESPFAKVVEQDGLIMFIGPVLNSNTSFHVYETLLLPDMAKYFPAVAATVINGKRRLVTQNWVPLFHRDFYAEGKRETRSWRKIREAKLLHSTNLGENSIFWYEAKKVAHLFATEIIPAEPDIFYCNSAQTCPPLGECALSIEWLKEEYQRRGRWNEGKIIQNRNRQFLKYIK